jgi:hypothetical protein
VILAITGVALSPLLLVAYRQQYAAAPDALRLASNVVGVLPTIVNPIKIALLTVGARPSDVWNLCHGGREQPSRRPAFRKRILVEAQNQCTRIPLLAAVVVPYVTSHRNYPIAYANVFR